MSFYTTHWPLYTLSRSAEGFLFCGPTMNQRVSASNILIDSAVFLGAVLVDLTISSIPVSWQSHLWLACTLVSIDIGGEHG